jgi:hypothetical protein
MAGRSSVREDHVGEHGIRGLVRIQIAIAFARQQYGAGQARDDVLREPRTPDQRSRKIPADAVVDTALVARDFERGRIVEPQVIRVAGETQLRQQVRVGAAAA